jgi:chromosome segregation ATPase
MQRRKQKMTEDTHDYNPTPVPVVEETPTEETNPMLASLKNFYDSAKEYTGLIKRVKVLEERLRSIEEQLEAVTTERDGFRIENTNLKDQVRALKDDNEHKAATLERTRVQSTEWMRRHDKEASEHMKLREEHEDVKDERDLAVLEVADWKRKLDDTTAELEMVKKQWTEAREQWFELESGLQNKIDELQVQRNKAVDRYDRCKSFAAQIMAMDQQH